MTYKTHILGGVLAGLAVAQSIQINSTMDVATVVGISTVASLLPDIDIPNSKVGNKMGVISKGINSVFGHRGLFHSPLLYLVIGFLLMNKVPYMILLGALVGVGSHLFLDMFNSTGIPVLYPLSKSKISVAKIKTRSFGEGVFAVLLVVGIAFMVYKMFI